MARFIGIRHRRKRTREGEERPTMVAIRQGSNIGVHTLDDETAELDFLKGELPIAWRDVIVDEEIQWFNVDSAPHGVYMHHCKWRKVKHDENVSELIPNHLRVVMDVSGKALFTQEVTKLPTAFEGLSTRDRVGMVLGGSGDRFAAALSRRGEEIGATVCRIPPFVLKEQRGDADKDDDHLTLAVLVEQGLHLFYKMRRRDRESIRVKEALSLRQDAMKARIGCEQRILQSLTGRIFLSEDGRFPEGVIKDQFDREKANDAIFLRLEEEEERRNKELTKAVRAVGIWEAIFAVIEGCGERLASGLIAAIGDIRRFWPAPGQKRQRGMAKLKAFCGVHVMQGGRFGEEVSRDKQFPRRRGGEVSNWHPDARQSLYLLADQFNRRPKSEWGLKLLEYKLKLRDAHPDIVEEEVKVKRGTRTVTEKRKRYTNGHIHKMAQWRTLTKFVEHLYVVWTRIEKEQQRLENETLPIDEKPDDRSNENLRGDSGAIDAA